MHECAARKKDSKRAPYRQWPPGPRPFPPQHLRIPKPLLAQAHPTSLPLGPVGPQRPCHGSQGNALAGVLVWARHHRCRFRIGSQGERRGANPNWLRPVASFGDGDIFHNGFLKLEAFMAWAGEGWAVGVLGSKLELFSDQNSARS